MKRRNFNRLISAAGLAAMGQHTLAGKAKQPNLLIIHTDEHNFRTLGCYRDLMTDDQSYVWGKGVKVETPHLDSLARDGAIATSYYAASPVCTPSRASIISGLYPVHTGSPVNDMPLNDDLVTFAEVLKRNGYATSYVGKWHLDGDAKPGFAPARKFGWDDNRYMINRGHWKMLEKDGNTAKFVGSFNEKNNQYKFDINDADELSFTTDFLCDRTLEIIERDKTKPFCVMVSIPDPHGPNHVRKPYDTMFADMHFENPHTMDASTEETVPGWSSIKGKNSAEKGLKQEQMQWYFGMVKCIDDNVGRILNYLESQGLADNTIVVFTSDHGDLMGEHKKHNKGVPFEASAKIPFLIRWPGHIPSGKVVRSAQSNIDFAPMALSMTGVKTGWPDFHGRDTSGDYLSPEKDVGDDRVVYITNAGSRWVAAVNRRYKLVLSPSDDPWLFDLKKDPDELINFYTHPEYKEIAEKMQAELMAQMERYAEPALANGNLIYETGGSAPQQENKALSSSEGYVVDSGPHAVKGEPGQWARAITVPGGTFEANTAYELAVEWESKGLDAGAAFFANFLDPKNKKAKQTETWTAVVGETGTLKAVLKTSGSKGWTLHVGVRDGGELLVKRIKIKKK
ncbi:Choline-sulfatase [Pontiella desulfatans]|uniref:Choline-sulfatase n=1 Tax=Pontiella desulfatans TaxID=2750659 RepID=A0A6C2UA92_PONDE|nr:sulfatase [Pontiella desulfatans]SPS74056.1 sulfatase S1_30 [Kiritimatiellales bacterium]VGO16441.1 Choline-sulfatase [Pontiella desulfatans]